MQDTASSTSDNLRITLELPGHLAVKLEKAQLKMGYQSRGAAIVNLLDLLLKSDEESQ